MSSKGNPCSGAGDREELLIVSALSAGSKTYGCAWFDWYGGWLKK